MLVMDYGNIVVNGRETFYDVSVHTFGRDDMIQIRKRTKNIQNKEEVVALYSFYTIESIKKVIPLNER